MIERAELLRLFHAARLAGRADHARAVAADWLASWPGDLEVRLLLAQAEVEGGLNRAAIARLNALTAADPEYVEALDLLATALRAEGEPVRAAVIAGAAAALRRQEPDPAQAPSWAAPLARALQQLEAGRAADALAQVQLALTADPALPLPTLTAVHAHLASGARAAALGMARLGHDRWPECIAFRLLLAQDDIDQGRTAQGVERLHRAAADDPTARVAARVLGSSHPYAALWPERLSARVSRAVPAEVAAYLGENRLPAAPQVTQGAIAEAPAGKSVEPDAAPNLAPAAPDSSLEEGPLPEPEPWEAFRGPNPGDTPARAHGPEAETLLEIQREFDRIAYRLKVPRSGSDADTRKPVYVIAGARTTLIQTFGEVGFRKVDQAAEALLEAVRRRSGWSGLRLYPDDPVSLRPFGLSPADPQNAWQLKLRLADLDSALARRGEMIGALLILGGPRLFPYHHLPNPTDDDDDAVPSDNPYATADENYFAPEWSVGRLPGDSDLTELLHGLRLAAEDHRAAARRAGWLARLRRWLDARLRSLTRRAPSSFGYSASIWRKASLAVYRAIGDPAGLVTSPPARAAALPARAARPARLSYYNLHGVEDGPEWFGQRDPFSDPEGAEEYPVALRPQDVVNSGRAPQVVFTEACYGANVIDKSREDALCLKFLASGTRALVGSTKISYGSITPPLIAADLLGRAFWDHLNAGLPAGEALRRAKLTLAAEMHRRQGFLDGEDQKTLISFVLLGDPLFVPHEVGGRKAAKQAAMRSIRRPTAMKTSCALGARAEADPLEPEALARVKTIVSRYLPGMADAQCRVHSQGCGCDGSDHCCPSQQLGIKRSPAAAQDTLVVTLDKRIAVGGQRHARLARLTLNREGKVLKLAVSR